MSALIPIQEQDGRQAVSGRDLHTFLGLGRDYTTWFKAMVEYGFTEGEDFTPVRVESSGGRPGTDHVLSLDMAKELAMIQRTPRGQEARRYFIEVEKQARQITVPQTYAEALEAAASEARKVEALEAKVAEIEPRAEAWDEIASAEGDYAVADAAMMLSRAGIPMGRDRLFDKLAELRWIYRGEKRRWRPYQSAIDAGYMAERAQAPHRDADGDLVASAPQVRVTLRGVERLRVRLGVLKAVS